MRRLPVILLAPVLTFLTLFAWALASPVGASPDDDFHLVSIWCASPDGESYCLPAGQENQRIVPGALLDAPCFAFDAEESAGCQRSLDFDATPDTVTARGNFSGGYPPLYYATMGLLASDNIEASAIAMRALNILLFTGLATALYVLLPIKRRGPLVWSWVITSVPLGVFVLSSNNPSAWAITGVGMGWIALLGYFETTGPRRIALGALFVVAAAMAAGSRNDAAMYMVLAIIAVGILTFRPTGRWAALASLPAAVAAMCLVFFRLSRPVHSLTQGLGGGGSGAAPDEASTNLFGLFAHNLLQGPSLWIGIFGHQWGLGWLDTSMPAVVWFGGFAVFVAVGFMAARNLDPRTLVVLVGGVLVLWLFPTVVLVGAGDAVGENMQPRYLLPLIVLFAGVMLLRVAAGKFRFTRAQTLVVVATLSVAHFIALNLNLRRYVSGFDDLGLNLDVGIEWWWNAALSPMAVWLLGSAAFAALLLVVTYGARYSPAAGETRSVRVVEASERQGAAGLT